jgi:hypothetical protein
MAGSMIDIVREVRRDCKHRLVETDKGNFIVIDNRTQAYIAILLTTNAPEPLSNWLWYSDICMLDIPIIPTSCNYINYGMFLLLVEQA